MSRINSNTLHEWLMGAPERLYEGFFGKKPLSEEVKQRLKDLKWAEENPDSVISKQITKEAWKDLQNPDAMGLGLDLLQVTPMGGLAGIIKNKGGKWAENIIGKTNEGFGVKDILDQSLFPRGRDVQYKPVEDWADNTLGNYIRQRMGTEQDELRKLADRGVTHLPSNDLEWGDEVLSDVMTGHLANKRSKYGMPLTDTASTDLGKYWERIIDDSIANSDYGYKLVGLDFDQLSGFSHLIDETKNMLDAGTHYDELWPKNLTLTPEQLSTTSVEDIVKKVAKVNQHREKMARLAARKDNERFKALEPIKEYEDGSRIVELPDTSTAEGIDLVRACGEKGQWCTQGEGRAKEYGSGQNRLLAVLDKHGTPVVQMTKHKPVHNADDFIERYPDVYRRLYDEAMQRPEFKNGGYDAVYNLMQKHMKNSPEYKAYLKEDLPIEINQIKGINNERPTDEQRRIVAKFIKSTGYKVTNDLENAGLIDMKPFSGGLIEGLMTKEEAIQAIHHLEENPSWIKSQQDIAARYGWEPNYSLDNWINAIEENY